MLWAAEKVVRGAFWLVAQVIGLHDYHLTDMQALSDVSKGYYNSHLRGGEAHMEVGVQSFITEKFPQAIFCPIETTGDGAVNVYARVQMMLFKARMAAKAELETRLSETGNTIDELRASSAH